MCNFPLLVSANSWVQILSSSVLVTKCVYASAYCAYFCIGNTVLCRGIRGKYHDWSSNTALKYSESCGFLNIRKIRLSGVVRLKLTGLILAILEYLRLAVNGVWQREANKYKLHRGYPISFSSEKPRHFKTRALAFPEGMSPWTLPVCFQENSLHDCAQTLKEICTNLRANVFKDCILTLTVHEEMSLHLIPVMENRNHFFALVSPHLINTYFIDKADWIKESFAALIWKSWPWRKTFYCATDFPAWYEQYSNSFRHTVGKLQKLWLNYGYRQSLREGETSALKSEPASSFPAIMLELYKSGRQIRGWSETKTLYGFSWKTSSLIGLCLRYKSFRKENCASSTNSFSFMIEKFSNDCRNKWSRDCYG